MERLKGKIAMVVGAGSIGPGWGNGKATAVTFAREGAQVFCVDRNQAAAQQTVDIITSEGGAATAISFWRVALGSGNLPQTANVVPGYWTLKKSVWPSGEKVGPVTSDWKLIGRPSSSRVGYGMLCSANT